VTNYDSKLRAQLITIISEVFECEICESATRFNTQAWDSLNHLKLIIELNDFFNIKIPSSDFEKLNSFNEILIYLSTIEN